MKEFANHSYISFEGALANLEFYDWPIASYVETSTLKRQTVSPELNFVVIPLTDQTLSDIWKELSKKDHLAREGIIHVQIESDGKLVFGGYDNFHRECTVAYSGVSAAFLDGLKGKGVIRGYQKKNAWLALNQ